MPPPPPNALHFPPEIVSIVENELSLLYLANRPPFDQGTCACARNHSILQLALVSKTWATGAVPVLYQDLCIEWETSTGRCLIQTLAERPHLLAMIHGVYAWWVPAGVLENRYLEDEADLEDLERQGRLVWDAGKKDQPPEKGGACGWRYVLRVVARLAASALSMALAVGKDGDWAFEDGVDEGVAAFWGLVARLPNLAHLRLLDFDDPLKEAA